MAKETIDPTPIIKELEERCLKSKGLEHSILGEVIDMLKAATVESVPQNISVNERLISAPELVMTLSKKCSGRLIHYDDLMAVIAEIPDVDTEQIARSRRVRWRRC